MHMLIYLSIYLSLCIVQQSIDRVAAMGDPGVRNFFQESLDFDENAAASDCTIRGAFCILLALLSL